METQHLTNHKQVFTCSTRKLISDLKKKASYNNLPLFLLYTINQVLFNLDEGDISDKSKNNLVLLYNKVSYQYNELCDPNVKLKFQTDTNNCINHVIIHSINN